MQHYTENYKYQNAKFFGYVFGVISLMSFWIMIPFGLQVVMYSPIVAIVAIIASLIFVSQAREIRREWEESQEPKKS